MHKLIVDEMSVLNQKVASLEEENSELRTTIMDKSWDKFTFVALFETHQTNSHEQIYLHLFSPCPHPIHVRHVYMLFLQNFNIVLGGKQRILKGITLLFKTPFKNTEN